MAAHGYGEYQSQRATLDDAVEVEATVVESDVQSFRDGDDGTVYRLTVTYEYEYEGERYEVSSFDTSGTKSKEYDSQSDAREALDEYPEGDRITAYVPPDDPGAAFLENDLPLSVYMIPGFGGFLVAASIFLCLNHFGRIALALLLS